MDGMEWRRQKWNTMVQYITKKAESIAVRYSDFLIADNLGIKKYLQDQYGATPVFLPYGAETVQHFDRSILETYSLKPKEYFLVIARLEPENNIETIINGFVNSNSSIPLVIIGGLSTPHAKKLISISGQNPKVLFLGGIYDLDTVNSLRHYCKAYFHGHTVGGTNPSLLEAMACGSFIIAHDNEFNRSVLEGNAEFFSNGFGVRDIITGLDDLLTRNENAFKNRNKEIIKTKYDWNLIIDSHEDFFKSVLRGQRKLSV
jgi:glycosyltransferase involved in cell wall biosynthesis